uniref:Uncharacterized protein n=1 Tax=Bodo saltans TaxID=75058 RepID=B6DTC1_BODSA|nr:hypothetical protein [Bodo saltans]
MSSSYTATVTLGPSLQRTTLLLPRPRTVSPHDTSIPVLPSFRTRSAGGDTPSLNVAILRRSVYTQRLLRNELRTIISDRGNFGNPSIPSKALARRGGADGDSSLKQRITSPTSLSSASTSLVIPNYDLAATCSSPADAATASGRPPTATSMVRSLLTGLVARTVPPQAGPSPRTEKDTLSFPIAGPPSSSLAGGDDDTNNQKHSIGTYLPYRAHDRFVDNRPPSRGGIAIFREKLHRDLEAALPQALLDGDVSYSAGTTSSGGDDGNGGGAVGQPTALPHNLLIPCVSRYPEAVHGPTGIESVAKEASAIRQPPPTSYVRELQRQSQMDSPGRCNSGEFQRRLLRPRSVDVLLGGRPRPPDGAVVVHAAPTQSTIASRRRVASSRKAFLAQQAMGKGDDAPLEQFHHQPSMAARPLSSLH